MTGAEAAAAVPAPLRSARPRLPEWLRVVLANGKARLGLSYVKLIRHPSSGDDFKQFMAEVRKFSITNISEGQSSDEWEAAYVAAHPPKKD